MKKIIERLIKYATSKKLLWVVVGSTIGLTIYGAVAEPQSSIFEFIFGKWMIVLMFEIGWYTLKALLEKVLIKAELTSDQLTSIVTKVLEVAKD